MGLGCGEQKLTAVNAEPDVDIASHDDGTEVGEGMPITILAVVDDADDPEEDLLATWTAGERTVCAATPVSEFGETTCTMKLSERESTVTVHVQDPRGSSGADAVRLDVVPTDAPQVEIVSPTSTGRYYASIGVEVTAMVSDSEDLAADLVVAWTLQDASLASALEPLDLPERPDADGRVGGYLDLAEGTWNIGVAVTDTSEKTTSASVQIDVGGPNRSPTCAWVAPEDGSVTTVDAPVTLRGTVDDLDWPSEANQLIVRWVSDVDDVIGESTPGSDGGVTLVASDLSVSAHTITLIAEDDVGSTCAAERSLVVTTRPEVELIKPRGEALYYSDHPVELEGRIVDAEDGPAALTATWESDTDGPLAVSPDVDAEGLTSGEVMLTEGSHTITLAGTDADGVAGSDSSTVVVRGPNQPPSCGIVSPESGSGGGTGMASMFIGVVDDADIGPEPLDVSWASNLDGMLGSSTPDSEGNVALSVSSLTVGTHTVSLSVTDEVGALCVDDIVFVVGRPPAVAIASPADGSVVNAGVVVTFLGTASDPDEPETALSVEWSSDIDGVIASGSPDSSGLTLATTGDLAIGTHTVTLTATDSLGLVSTAVTVFRVNALPTTPSIRISPDPARTTDTLSVDIDVPSVDVEGEAITYRTEWFLDGVLVSESGTVPPSDTAKHQRWEVRLTPTDGYGEGVGGVASRTILNTVPVVEDVRIGPEDVFTNTLAATEIEATDPDGDTLYFSHAWVVNGSAVGDAGSSLDGTDHFDKHDVIQVSVTPSDDDEVGVLVEASAVVVQNSPPSAPLISIAPEGPVGGMDVLQCSIDGPGEDADGDPVLYALSWERDGDPYPDVGPEDTGLAWVGPLTDDWTDDTVPAEDTHPDEAWTCSVTSWDDEGPGDEATASVLLSAPPPGCGDGILQPGEEYDPAPGPYLNVSVDPDTCRWDFSEVEQLYCFGFCSWAGPPGCDDADADVLCKLITDNPDSEAISYTITAPLSEPGFPGIYCGFGDLLYTDRGVPDVGWMDESMAAHHGGGGEVVAFPDCTDP